jgi:hypothetical protein
MLSRVFEALAWTGTVIGIGIATIGAADAAGPAANPRLGLPPADVINAYGLTFFGLVTMTVNGFLALYQGIIRARAKNAELEAERLIAVARLEATRLRAGRVRKRKPHPEKPVKPEKTDAPAPTPKPDS